MIDPRSAMRRLATAFVAVVTVSASAGMSHAQMAPMGLPIPTTIVITKPAPDQIYGDKPIVTVGIGTKTYKFVLKDAYVDTMRPRIKWPDIWQQVRQYRPNFKVVGVDEDVFEKLQPGQTMTVRGMYTPLGQNFEVIGSDIGGGNFQPPAHY